MLRGLGDVLGRHRMENVGTLRNRTFLGALLPRPMRARWTWLNPLASTIGVTWYLS